MKIENRFLKYISFDTQSDESSSSNPSTAKQKVLGDFLAEEMRILKFENVVMDEYGIVYGTIPGNTDKGDIIGFIAHMDTSPETSGLNVNPQVIRNYDGSVITINEELNMYLDPLENPELNHLLHHDLITTDGTTLLGADDKAGIAIIMSMAEYLYRHPEFKHNDIRVAFTCDEEIGRGSDHFNIERFHADYAYTVDGGDIEEFSYENFNAYKADIIITGKNVHPGAAKNKMINALTLARDFDVLLGDIHRPEHTDNYDGFYHLVNMSGDVSHVSMHYILREHNKEKLYQLIANMDKSKEYLNDIYGERISIHYTKQYENMREIIESYPHITKQVEIAMLDNNMTPHINPTRGGTDGAMLSFKGLPCPNLGTGGYNYHGPYEFVSITSMKKGVELLLTIIKNNVRG